MSVQNLNAFSGVVSGFKYLPASLAVQALTVTTASLAGLFTCNSVRDVLFPDDKICGRFERFDLPQKVIALTFTAAWGIVMGVVEEVFIRGVLQIGLLTKAPRMFLSPYGRGHWADAMIARVARCVVTAWRFSEMHLSNTGAYGYTQEKLNFQLANAFGLGLVASAVTEAKGSVWPAVGIHAAYNTFFMTIPVTYCILHSKESAKESNEPTSKLQSGIKA
jgi:membrane protease YdiL (CAAX protease family)